MIKNFTYLLLGILMMPIVAFSQEKESGPSRRAAWERSITKDPKTGMIPRNELEKARTSMLKSARTSAAINTINWKERGPNNVGGRTRALMFDPNDATNKKVWAGGVSGGLWYNNDITDANSSWNKVNDFWDNIAIGDIAFDPSNKQIMYAGTGERATGTVSNTGNSGSGGNGIWKTTNGGTSWTRLTSTIPDYVSSTPSLAVGWREISKILVNSTGTVFVLNMNGVYKSTNGGVSWTTLGVTTGPSPSYDTLRKVTDMELGTDDILYVSQGSGDYAHQPAIYKATSTAATSFTTITPPGTFNNCRVELALAPSTSGASQVIYAIGATSQSLPRVQFFRKSINAGTTWTNVTVPQHNDEQDSLKTVVLVPNVGDQGDYGLILGVHATNPDIMYAGGVAFNISYNGGSSWLPIVNWVKSGEMMHNDHHAFARRPGTGNENHAIFGHDGGVSYSANWGITPPAPTPTTNGYPTFGTRVKNYNVTQYFAIDVHNSTESLIGGAQDNGTHTITSASSTVGDGYSISGGDGALCFFDQNDPNIVISSYIQVVPYIHIKGPRSIANNGERLNVHTNSKRGRFINPADYDSPNHTLYMDYSLGTEPNARIIRYHVTGSSPDYTAPNDTLTLTGIPPSSISFLKLGKSTLTKTLYVGMANGDVYKVTGIPVARKTVAGDLVIPAASITKIMDKSTTSEGNVSSIDYGTTAENIMVVTKSNYNIKSVFYTINGGGAEGRDWTSKDETAHGLPNIPIRYALISPLDNKNVLLATELGVWSTQDITATNPGWESTNYQTLANVRTDMLKYKASDQTVSVGTHGRGIFTGKINENLPCQVPVDLTISSNSPFVDGLELRLYSSSKGGTSYTWAGPNGFTSNLQNPIISTSTSVMAGVYTVSIASAGTCTATATTVVSMNTVACVPLVGVEANRSAFPTIGGSFAVFASPNGATRYIWTGPNGFTSVDQNPQISLATLAMSGVYSVNISNGGTCTATATVNILVVSTACVANQLASSNSPVSVGGTIMLTSSPSGGSSYNWAGPNGFTSELQNPSITSAATEMAGTYTVTILSGSTLNGTVVVRGFCTATATTTVIVNPAGTCTPPTLAMASSNSPVTVGAPINLTSSSTGGTSQVWAGPSSFTSTAQNPVIASATTVMAGVYTVTITSSSTCTATATTNVVVNPASTSCTPPTAATAGSNSPVTEGSPINLTSSSTGGTSQSWLGSNGYTSTAQNPVIATLAAGVYNFTVTITSSGTCVATATTSVRVNSVPTTCTPPTGATASSNSPVTEGSPINLTSSSTGGTSQSWLGSNGYTSTAQNPVIATLAAGVYNFTVTITSSGTCVATATTSVVVNPTPTTCTPPTGATASSNSPVTEGSPINLTSSSTGGTSQSWLGSNGYTSTAQNPVIATLAAGVYNFTVTITSSGTCVATATTSVRVNSVPITCTPPTLATASSNSPVTEGSPINLTSSSTGGTSQSWLGSNGYTSTAQNPVIATLAAGVYNFTVTITSSGTCVATATTSVRVNSVPTSSVVFVNIANTNTTQNGNAWATAYSNMQTALSSAPANSAFWVAKGVYKPTATTDRNISFNIPSGAKLYGGFVGTETMLSQGNIEANPTILSGEIGSPSTVNDNSYHVVTFIGANSATVLDGFTVTGGNASFNSTRPPSSPNSTGQQPLSIYDGGGIGLDNRSSPTIVNCRIISNDAIQGGGLYATNNSNPTVKNSVVMNNQATFGGGIYNLKSNPTYSNILIAGNKATGGAMYNNGSNPTITNVTIAGNGGYNGAIFNSNSAPVVKNSILWGNISPFNDTQSVTSYSIVEGGYLGVGNLSIDPQFINLVPYGLSPSLSGDYKLTNTSPAIDAGDNGVVGMTDTDLGNFPRRFNSGIVDVGAYEFQGSRMGGTVTSIVSGNWEQGTTWNIGRKPLAGDTVIINNNHIVTVNNNGVMKNIEIRPNATLLYKTSGIKLQTGF